MENAAKRNKYRKLRLAYAQPFGVTHTRFVGYVYIKLTTSFYVIYYRLTKWQIIFYNLAENGRQKICICPKVAVPL